MITTIKSFESKKSLISHKYMNHGMYVPIQKCYKFNNNFLKNKIYISIRTYTTSSSKPLDNNYTNYIKVYENAFDMKKDIIKENKGKSGIFMSTNKITNEKYIEKSSDISKRFKNYFNLSYIKSKGNFIISRALIKYGYFNFYVTILEYCAKFDLLVREQHYFDKFNPQYNILKIAGSSLDFKHSEDTKAKISKSLRGVYTKEKSALFGRLYTEETKKLISLKKAKENNPLFGKTQNKDTIELMRQKALGRLHSEDTKLKMSAVSGNPVNIYEKCSSDEYQLIGGFVSARRAGKFLGISGSTVIRYMNSGEVFKDRYKFSSK